jgi:hypothetical protein
MESQRMMADIGTIEHDRTGTAVARNATGSKWGLRRPVILPGVLLPFQLLDPRNPGEV